MVRNPQSFLLNIDNWRSGSGKTNALINLINHEPDIDKIYYMLKIHMKQNINC